MTELIEEMSSRELPGIIPFRVYEHLINCFVSKWQLICLTSFVQVEETLRSAVGLLVEKHFGRFENSGLMYEVRLIPFHQS